MDFNYGLNPFAMSDGSFMGVMFPIMFFAIITLIVVTAIQGLMQWNKNNNSPVLTVDAKIVAKRQDVSHSTGGNTDHSSSTTWYYVTFQVESGDRMELSVNGREYGKLAEGDQGRLTFQGTRYKEFQRV